MRSYTTKTAGQKPPEKFGERWAEYPPIPILLVSNLGNVWNVKTGRRLHPSKTGKGYYSVNVRYENGKSKLVLINRAVLWAFKGPPPSDQHQAAHIDGVKTNNYLGNLHWVTPKENARHKKAIFSHGEGEKNSQAKISNLDALRIAKMLDDGQRPVRIAELFGVSRHLVYSMKRGRSWTWLTGRTPVPRR